jgi:hypothetical protein
VGLTGRGDLRHQIGTLAACHQISCDSPLGGVVPETRELRVALAAGNWHGIDAAKAALCTVFVLVALVIAVLSDDTDGHDIGAMVETRELGSPHFSAEAM